MAASCALAVPFIATAQTFEAPAAQGYGNLLGDPTAGAETGVFEIQSLVISAIGVGIALVVLYTGWKHLRKAGGKV